MHLLSGLPKVSIISFNEFIDNFFFELAHEFFKPNVFNQIQMLLSKDFLLRLNVEPDIVRDLLFCNEAMTIDDPVFQKVNNFAGIPWPRVSLKDVLSTFCDQHLKRLLCNEVVKKRKDIFCSFPKGMNLNLKCTDSRIQVFSEFTFTD